MNRNNTFLKASHTDDLYKPIITSLMDSDKYKISMSCINHHRYPDAKSKTRFKCRNAGVDLTPIAGAIRYHLSKTAELRYQDSELRFLQKESHLTPDFIEYLSDFKLNEKNIHVEVQGGKLDIFTEGTMAKDSPWEIYVMSIVNELWYRYTAPNHDLTQARLNLMNKIKFLKETGANGQLNGFNFTDFGTRRRFSKDWQREVISTLKSEVPEYFVGTSNYHFAQEFDLKPIGTMAHEYLQAWQGMVHPFDALKVALDNWALEFRGNLGDALTDVVGMDAFCDVLDMFLAKQFDGFRHDSGNPYLWGDKLIAKLEQLNIDPKTKRAIWSDGLDFKKAIDLFMHFNGKIKTGFGIGTSLTNDTGLPVLNNVMKLIEVNGRPVAKLPDSQGKGMCECPAYESWMMNHYPREYTE